MFPVHLQIFLAHESTTFIHDEEGRFKESINQLDVHEPTIRFLVPEPVHEPPTNAPLPS